MRHKSKNTKGYPSQRQLRVSELIKRELAELILRIEFFDNNFETSSISISEVRCSPDLKIATVYVISIENEKSENFVELLNQHKKEFRYQLGKNLNLKFTPEIRFVKDISIDQMLKTERLIESTKK